ncbi:MAG: M16 family metallopeptidase [Terriglobia bacterium]
MIARKFMVLHCKIRSSLLFAAFGLMLAVPLAARDLPPLVPSPQPATMPAPTVKALANGLQVLVLERHRLPMVTLTFAVRAGSAADPRGLPGMAQFVASLLNEGTSRRSALEISSAIDDAGGEIDTGADWNDSYATLTMLSDHTRLAFDLLSGMAIRPAFEPSEVERARKQILSALEVLRDDPGYLADTAFERVVFAGTRYSHPAEGVAASVRRITPRDLKKFHARYYRPNGAVLLVVGDVDASEAFALARDFFGEWRGKVPSTPSARRAPLGGKGRRIIVIDDPGAVQTEIRIGNPAVGRASPDYDALTVANQILGGPAENLLFSALRSRRGLVYGASSDLVAYRGAGAWEIKTSTRTAETLKAVDLVLSQMKRLDGRAIQDEGVRMAQEYLVGHMALQFETQQQITDQLLSLLMYGLPLDYWNTFPQRIRTLTISEVSAAARRYLEPDRAVIVLVGDASKFKQNLKKLGETRVIPLAETDFASPTLERNSAELASRHAPPRHERVQ